MVSFEIFKGNLEQVRNRIRAACQSAGRSTDSVRILPVTKNHPVGAVDYAMRAGLTAVGENRVQEATQKKTLQLSADLKWELIGHLQTNKAKDAVALFDRIQSVDSVRLLSRLNHFAEQSGKLQPILLQCNTGADPNKYGFKVEEMETAIELVLQAKHLRIDGLMTIAPLAEDTSIAKSAFDKLRELRDRLSTHYKLSLTELSMGMTGDLEMAIAAGSTQIRVGTALYGARS